MGKLLLVIVILGVAIYLVVRMAELLASRRRARRGGGGGGSLGRLKPTPRPSGPLGPDDDPEFLRDLNRRKRPKDAKDE